MGYGDIPLTQDGTHIAVGIYTFLSTILLAFAISNVTDIYREKKKLAKMLAIAERKQTLSCLRELDLGQGVPRDTFILAVLEQLGILSRENDIEPWLKVRTEQCNSSVYIVYVYIAYIRLSKIIINICMIYF